jgi:hypothetical protein
MPSWKKTRPKVRGKRDVVDEYDLADIDRNEQKAGIKRRERRWKEIELKQKLKKAEIDNMLKKADKINPNIRQGLTPQQELWLQVDYCLAYLMEEKAHRFLDDIRIQGDIKTYNKLLNIFFSDVMRANLQNWLNYFDATGCRVPDPITLASVVREYRKIKGIKKTNIKIVRKGEKDKEL